MTSNKYFFRYLILICLPLWAAEVSSSQGEDEINLYIKTHKEVSAIFSGANVATIQDNRLGAWVSHNDIRRALVLYKPIKKSQSGLGQMYCHSALGQKERGEAFNRILKEVKGDRAIAKRLSPNYAPVIRFIKTEDIALKDWQGWKIVTCQVKEIDIKVTLSSLPSSDDVVKSIYAEGKADFYRNNYDSAMSRFKSLKSAPEAYANSLFYLVVILSEKDPVISDTLRQKYLQLDKATDASAIEAYYQYLAKSGNTDELLLVSEFCRQQQWACGAKLIKRDSTSR